MRKLIRLLPALLIFLCWSSNEVRADLVVDPTSDTYGTESVQLDITSINATFSGSNITFFVSFAGGIAPPSALAPNSVVGFIDIDTDQNTATGDVPFINVFSPGPPIALGQDFFVDLGSEFLHPGSVDIFRTLPDTVVGAAPIVFTSTSFSVTVPLALLGNDDGLLNYGAVIGTFLEPTDRAPNGTLPATSQPIPEPATLLLLGTGLAGVAAKVRKRRNARNTEGA
jgi:hypothetical protein